MWISFSLFVIGLLLGAAAGGAVVWWVLNQRQRDRAQLHQQALEQKQQETENLVSQLKDSFAALSAEALGKSTEQFFEIAKERLGQQSQHHKTELDGKKQLIDQTLTSMKGELEKVNKMVGELEQDRKIKFGQLSQELEKSNTETRRLRETTHELQTALTNSRVRGQWGERMAEDVLRLSGFVEGINYRKQSHLSDASGTTARPDYTFYLPNERVVHMDVKFPLENYLAYLNSDNESEKASKRQQFLKDARTAITDVSKRAYTNDETLDYVLVFIPNEQVYSFVQEHDPTLLDDALSKKIILCSPLTLYAILAVIRQAVDNFHLERHTGEILKLLGTFKSQWDKFTGAMDKVGKKLDESQRAYDELTGPRRRMLEKPLQQIAQLEASDPKLRTATGEKLQVIEGGE